MIMVLLEIGCEHFVSVKSFSEILNFALDRHSLGNQNGRLELLSLP